MILQLEPPLNQHIPASSTLIAEFCQRWHITEFALFGSVLRDDFRPDSDIDVLLTFSPERWLTLDDWQRIVGLRNIVAHRYDEVRQDILWTIINSDLTLLLSQLEALLPPLPEQTEP